MTLAFNIITSSIVTLPGLMYFTVAGFVDLSIVILLEHVRAARKLRLHLIQLCMASVCINLAGMVAWWGYSDMTMYYVTFAIFYMVAAGVIVIGGRGCGVHYLRFSNFARGVGRHIVKNPNRAKKNEVGE